MDLKKTLVKFLDKTIGSVRIYPGGIIFWGDKIFKVSGSNMRQILGNTPDQCILKPMDILVRRYDSIIAGLVIPGYWIHAAIYVGNNKVIHVISEGIVKQDILTFLRSDNIAIYRVKPERLKETGFDLETAHKRALDTLRKGAEYDWDFKTDFRTNTGNLKNLNPNDDLARFYCTEFVWYCFKEVLGEQKDIIYPDEVTTDPNLDLIYLARDYDGFKRKKKN